MLLQGHCMYELPMSCLEVVYLAGLLYLWVHGCLIGEKEAVCWLKLSKSPNNFSSPQGKFEKNSTKSTWKSFNTSPSISKFLVYSNYIQLESWVCCFLQYSWKQIDLKLCHIGNSWKIQTKTPFIPQED